MIHETILGTIGNTPVVRIQRLAPAHVAMYVKCEAFNPMSSVKDRLAIAMIEDAERRGVLKPGALPAPGHKRRAPRRQVKHRAQNENARDAENLVLVFLEKFVRRAVREVGQEMHEIQEVKRRLFFHTPLPNALPAPAVAGPTVPVHVASHQRPCLEPSHGLSVAQPKGRLHHHGEMQPPRHAPEHAPRSALSERDHIPLA